MGSRENRNSIPNACKNYACLRILEISVKDRISKESNAMYASGLKANLEGIEIYLKFFNKQSFVATFPHQIRRHLNEIDHYYETGVWKRIYSS